MSTDDRGTVRELFRGSIYFEVLPKTVTGWKQINLTRTKKGAVRGLHGEAMSKLVTVAYGSVSVRMLIQDRTVRLSVLFRLYILHLAFKYLCHKAYVMVFRHWKIQNIYISLTMNGLLECPVQHFVRWILNLISSGRFLLRLVILIRFLRRILRLQLLRSFVRL